MSSSHFSFMLYFDSAAFKFWTRTILVSNPRLVLVPEPTLELVSMRHNSLATFIPHDLMILNKSTDHFTGSRKRPTLCIFQFKTGMFCHEIPNWFFSIRYIRDKSNKMIN